VRRRRFSRATAAALLVLGSGCGHQVTPEPFGDDLSGHILVRMQTEGSLDFNDLTYVIAVDNYL
jgi:hypothetical protein